jgi:hypothetical protein
MEARMNGDEALATQKEDEANVKYQQSSEALYIL